jgi:hypothetical protein
MTREPKFYGWLCCAESGEKLRWATFEEASASDHLREEYDPLCVLGDIERNDIASFYHSNMQAWVYVEED